MSQLSVGVLSTAHPHSHAYVDAVTAVEDAVVVCVADEDAQRGRAFAQEHDVDYVSRADLWNRIDAGIVCGANANHADWAIAAADAGVDLLCEKPLATTVADARRIIDACSNITLGVAMPMRFSDPVRQAKRAIEQGALGDLQTIVGTNLLQKMDENSWFVDPDRAGGGAIMDHTVHVVDLGRWLTGEEVTELYAETGTRFHDIAVEDINVLSMELSDGTTVTHDGSWRQPDEWEFWGDVTLRLIGTEGVLTVDCFAQSFALTRDSGEQGRNAVFWGSDTNEGLIRDFVEAIRDNRQPAISGEDGLRELEVVEAAYQSAENGVPISLE